MASKTLFIGLDGAEPELIQRWAKDGSLPNIAQLLKDYHQYVVQSPKGFGDGGLWSSFVTAVNPGKHGHYFPTQFNPATYMLDRFNIDQDLQRDPFWYFCSKMGRTVGVIDIYTSPLRTGLNGIQVMDWMIHDRMSEPRSWPANLIDTLQQSYMPDPLEGNSETKYRSDADYLTFHQGVIDRIGAKTQASVDLLTDNQWDLFCVGFCDPHDVGHQSWHWHDATHPRHPARLVAEHGNPLLQTYQKLDASIGQLIDSAKPQHVFLLAGLGMATQSLCNAGLQQILAHYCGVEGNRDEAIRQRQKMAYFELPHNMHAGAIRINLQGRESMGLVAQQDYQRTLDHLSAKLHDLRDADDGSKIVDEIVYVHDRYPGNFKNDLPDLFVVWKKPLSVKRIRVDEHKTVDLEAVYRFEFRTGDHTANAALWCSDQYQQQTVEAASIAPTICNTLGVNLPETDAPAMSLV